MNVATKAIHTQLEQLGRTMGFRVEQEVSNSVLQLRLAEEKQYQPRVDLMWSLPLTTEQQDALAWVLGRDAKGITHLPVVGIEVEGTTPSTKTQESDVANMLALGAPLGLLVVTEAGEKGIYARAARAIRTLRRAYGDVAVLPMEAGWLPGLLRQKWPVGMSAPPPRVMIGASGGETGEWPSKTRAKLRTALPQKSPKPPTFGASCPHLGQTAPTGGRP